MIKMKLVAPYRKYQTDDMLREISALRFLAVLASLVFIPAFWLGAACVWAPVFAVVAGRHWRARLERVIGVYQPLKDRRDQARFISRTVPRLVYECIFITALPQLVALWLSVEGAIAPKPGIDAWLYEYLASVMVDGRQYEALGLTARYFAACLLGGVMAFVGLGVLGWRQTWRVAADQYYHKAGWWGTREETKRWAKYNFGTEMAMIGVLASLIFFASAADFLAEVRTPLAAAMLGAFSAALAYIQLLLVVWFLVGWRSIGTVAVDQENDRGG